VFYEICQGQIQDHEASTSGYRIVLSCTL